MTKATEEFNKNIKEVMSKVTGWNDGPEDKYVIIDRLVGLARQGKYVGVDYDIVTEAIMSVQEEWEE